MKALGSAARWAVIFSVLEGFRAMCPVGAPAADGAGANSLGAVPGWIVFDSKRDGQFDIYKMRADGSQVTRLTNTPEWESTPDWSPDGRSIVFARKEADADDIAGGIYIMDADGAHERLLVTHGTAPQFTADGKRIIFERDHIDLCVYDLATGGQRRLTPPAGGPPFPHYMIKPRLSPDGLTVLFISDKRGKWHSWAMDMEGRERLIGPGCQPTWHPDGRRIFYIADSSYQENAIWTFDWPEGGPRLYLALTGTYRHLYFPSVSDDGKYLLFAACPANQHDHSTAHYQIFIKPLEGGEPVQISRNDFTERWPRLCTKAR